MASTVPADKLTLSSFTHEFIMISHDQERIVATGHAVMVMFNFEELCKANLPEHVVRTMAEAEKVAGSDLKARM